MTKLSIEVPLTVSPTLRLPATAAFSGAELPVQTVYVFVLPSNLA